MKVEAKKWYKIEWKDGDIDLFYCEKIEKDKLIFNDEKYFRNGAYLSGGTTSISLSSLKEDDRRVLSIPTAQEIFEVSKEEVVWLGCEMQYWNDDFNEWRDCSKISGLKYRLKPKPDYSKEIEALKAKAKENGEIVIIKFEKDGNSN